MYVGSPAGAVIEQTVAGWLREVFGPRRHRARGQRGLHHGLQHGELHRPGGGAPRGIGARQLGRRGAGAVRRAGHRRGGGRRGPRLDLRGAADAGPGARAGDAHRRRRPGQHAGRRPRRGARGPRRADHRLRPGGQCEQRGVRSLRRDRRGLPRAPGLASRRRRLRPVGRRRARPAPLRRRVSSGPIPGPPTATSGSTCPTIRASSCAPIRRPTVRR